MPIDLEDIAAQKAPAVARELLRAARRGGSEADFRREAARVLEEAGTAAGLTIVPRDEFSVARGRVDSVYNRLVLEYKRPGILRPENTARPNQAAVKQVKDYILDVARRERREAHRLAGVATDGFFLVYVRRVGEGWAEPEIYPVNAGSVERLLRLLFSLAVGRALVPDNLVEDFGPGKSWARKAVGSLHSALERSEHPLVTKLFEQWRLFFSEATDYSEWAARIKDKKEFRGFLTGMGLDLRKAEAPRVFFALHTYYALLIKLVASLAAARFAGGLSAPLAHLAAKEGPALREALAQLESGGLFKEYGIRNFLEGDFFRWYLSAWDEDIEKATGDLARRLAEYDPGTIELAPENARDLLKKLYHKLLPKEIRHDLGEYYTPDWLAERLIIQTLGKADLGDPTKRVLDPACGSGTFLVILIKHIRERARQRGLDPATVLDLILRNVVGFDLNPLAVIAARTNYLLALGDLLRARKHDIDIPVYQADSVMTPSRGTDLFTGQVYPLPLSVGVFRVPAMFDRRERLDALANELDSAVESGLGEEAFLVQLARAAGLSPEELEAAREELAALYRQLHELHEQGMDGVWARVIKNAFAPLFIEPCDYIVGNPPWVNWEHLPDDYRRSTVPLWQHYGLFPHRGMDTILGKGKKDISMLMTYVAVDRYLRRGGKLGFVVSQSLFKTSGAGQGFRRFLLPDKTPFGPVTVEDMVELKPFEGATNRTAVAVFAKGRAVSFPVPYTLWRKRQQGRGSAIGFDTPYEEVTKEKITSREWFAEPVDRDDRTSAWLTGRKKALKALHDVLGNSPYSAHAGSFTGGANGVYWVEIMGMRPGGLAIVANLTEGARREVLNTQAAVEVELLYPLLRGRDVRRWAASPSAHILMMQDPQTRRGISAQTVKEQFPNAYSYLAKFEKPLRARAAYGRYFRGDDPYWSMFNVSDFTFSPYKVVWREQAVDLTAAIVGPADGRPVVPDHKLMMVATSTPADAHYLCAALNSSIARFAVGAYAVQIQMDTHVLDNVAVPKFSAKDPVHLKLSELSQTAHKAAARGDQAEVKRIEEEIDLWSAKLWGLSDDELAEIKRSLEEA